MQQVGVVGRTGSCKSSLALALFRILEASRGFIEIDDQNIAHLGLHDIRGRISIIPQVGTSLVLSQVHTTGKDTKHLSISFCTSQEPVLFSGSIRFNLDPAGIYFDQEIWNALKDAHLKDYVNSLPGKLQHVCDDDGGNMRQAKCSTNLNLSLFTLLDKVRRDRFRTPRLYYLVALDKNS